MKSAQETSTPQSPPITTLSDIMSVIIIIKLWWSECELECKWLIIGRTLLWGWKKKDACHAQSGQSELDEGARSTGVNLARSHPAQIEMVQCLPVWTCCSDPKLPSGHFKGSAQLYHKKKKKNTQKTQKTYMAAVVTCSSTSSVQSSLSCSPHNITCALYDMAELYQV